MSIPRGLQASLRQAYTFQTSLSLVPPLTIPAIQTETSLKVTLKIRRFFTPLLIPYLRKLKDAKHDDIIRLYDLLYQDDCVCVAMQPAPFGTLAQALSRCSYLDDAQALLVGKILLTGHVELLKLGIQWTGDMTDIEITDTGIKLSWNGALPRPDSNPMPLILQALTPKQKGGSKLLPINVGKQVKELLRISGESASQISLSPIMKKQEKQVKRKGRKWMSLKETKSPKEYFEETVCFAVHQEIGFVRIKIYDQGNLDPLLVALNSTKSSFARMIDQYNQGDKTFIISQYSNEGTLQNYVSRIKAEGLTLKEEHIEFFLLSLFEPLKAIQSSSIQALKMVHIRNIYMESGVPKLGEPIPINENLKNVLRERSDVPDFYHSRFKANPDSTSEVYDTYSLGVLLYKLMYTEYPIFPKGSVHIPSTPNYSKRLKNTLQMLLNEGGTLASIEGKIQVTQEVLSLIQENKAKLIAQKTVERRVEPRRNQPKARETQANVDEEKLSRPNNDEKDEIEELDGCCESCCIVLNASNENAAHWPSVEALQLSPYRSYRIWLKVILSLTLYICLLYIWYLPKSTQLIDNVSQMSKLTLTLSTINYTIATPDKTAFFTAFNTTNSTVESLVNMGCYVDGYNGGSSYSTFAVNSWRAVLVGATISWVLIMALKGYQVALFDTVRAQYRRQSSISNFNLSNWITFNLLWCILVNIHFHCFNVIYYSLPTQCLGASNKFRYSSTKLLFDGNEEYLRLYISLICGVTFLQLLHCIVIWKSKEMTYNRLWNPILVLGLPIGAIWVIVRIGIVSGYYYPNALQDLNGQIKGYFLNGDHVGILATVPEAAWLCQLLIGLLIDSLFWGTIEKKRQTLLNDQSQTHLYIEV